MNPTPEDKPKPTVIHTGHPPPSYDQKLRRFGNISGDADGVLTRLFLNICYDLTNNQYFTQAAWRKMMDKYLDELVKHDPEINRQNERGNFTKALNAPKMSWKTFFKSLRLLRFVRIRFILECEREDGTVTSHSTTVSLLQEGTSLDDASVDVMKDAAKEIRDGIDKDKKDTDK